MLTMVEHGKLADLKMGFKPNQVVSLPELAAHLGLASPAFRVDRIIRGGMGECIRVVQNEKSFALKVIQHEIVDDPDAWTIQGRLRFSRAPIWGDGAVTARPAMVRVYAIADGGGRWHVLPGGMTRVAEREDASVSMQRRILHDWNCLSHFGMFLHQMYCLVWPLLTERTLPVY